MMPLLICLWRRSACSIAATMEADRALRQTLWLLLAFWNIALVLQISAGWGFISLPSVDPWYWDRFRGWSENPNQLALNCAVLTPLSLHLGSVVQGPGPHRRTIQLPAVLHRRPADQERYIPDCDDGYHRALSDTAVAELVELARAQISLRFAIAVLVVAAIVPLSLSLTPYAVATATNVESMAISLTKDHGGEATKATANLRLQLWGDALHSGLESGSLGLGPGPHLERPNVVNKHSDSTSFRSSQYPA